MKNARHVTGLVHQIVFHVNYQMDYIKQNASTLALMEHSILILFAKIAIHLVKLAIIALHQIVCHVPAQKVCISLNAMTPVLLAQLSRIMCANHSFATLLAQIVQVLISTNVYPVLGIEGYGMESACNCAQLVHSCQTTSAVVVQFPAKPALGQKIVSALLVADF